MSSAFRIATVRGIPIRLHYTFLAALPLIAYAFGRVYVGPLTSLALGGILFALQPLVAGAAFNLRFALFYLAGGGSQ